MCPLLAEVYSWNLCGSFLNSRDTITWTLPQSHQHAIEEEPGGLTALGYVEQLPEEGPKLVDVGCLPVDRVLNQPEGILQFFSGGIVTVILMVSNQRPSQVMA